MRKFKPCFAMETQSYEIIPNENEDEVRQFDYAMEIIRRHNMKLEYYVDENGIFIRGTHAAKMLLNKDNRIIARGYIKKLDDTDVKFEFCQLFSEEYARGDYDKGFYDEEVELLEELESQKLGWLESSHKFHFSRCDQVFVTVKEFKKNAKKAQELLPHFWINFYLQSFKYHKDTSHIHWHYTESMKGFIH